MSSRLEWHDQILRISLKVVQNDGLSEKCGLTSEHAEMPSLQGAGH